MKNKRLLSLFLSIVLLSACPVGLFDITSSAETATSGTTGDCTWTLDGTALTIGGNGSMASYSSSDVAPWGTAITEVIINNGVTGIGAYAFLNCGELVSASIPGSVASIGRSAFRGCGKLANAVLPAGITSISDYLFDGCGSLASVTIPDSVTSIGIYAFRNCGELVSASIPGSVASIGKSAFRGCGKLANAVLPAGITSISDYLFDGCGSLASVTIPDSVTSIGKSTFQGCNKLTTLSIPTGVTSIADNAFKGCSALTSISIPDNIVSIGNAAFEDCTNLEYNFSKNGRYLGNEENKYLVLIDIVDKEITKFNFTAGTKIIYENAFNDCTVLESIVLPSTITSIGESAFKSCTALDGIKIRSNVKSIGKDAFNNCTNLKKVSISDLSAWCNISFGNSLANPLFYAEGFSVNGVLTTDITIPDTVKEIKKYAFYNCTGMKSLTIPSSVTSIGTTSFSKCKYLENLTFKAQTVPTSAFDGCLNLKKIYFSKNLTKICSNAFKSANKITDIYYEGTEEDWEKVVIEESNGSIGTATVHYNRTGISNVASMTITSMPSKLFYKLGEALDVTGGKIKFVYDDGSEELVDISDNMLTGYDCRKYGKQEITVTYKECAAKFAAEIYKTGDIDGDERIGASDITQLRKCLLSVITGNVKFDVNGDGETDIRDLVRIKKLATG